MVGALVTNLVEQVPHLPKLSTYRSGTSLNQIGDHMLDVVPSPSPFQD